MLAMRIPISAMANVNTKALSGSPFFVVTLKKRRKGMMSSLAIACNRRGAPTFQV